jgi:hypothetical protein
MIGTGINMPSVSTIIWSPPTSNLSYGIHLSPLESIFIPNAIYISALIADGLPPLYGKIVESGVSSTEILSIMAV